MDFPPERFDAPMVSHKVVYEDCAGIGV